MFRRLGAQRGRGELATSGPDSLPPPKGSARPAVMACRAPRTPRIRHAREIGEAFLPPGPPPARHDRGATVGGELTDDAAGKLPRPGSTDPITAALRKNGRPAQNSAAGFSRSLESCSITCAIFSMPLRFVRKSDRISSGMADRVSTALHQHLLRAQTTRRRGARVRACSIRVRCELKNPSMAKRVDPHPDAVGSPPIRGLAHIRDWSSRGPERRQSTFVRRPRRWF